MKVVIVLAIFVAAATAQYDRDAVVLRNELNNNGVDGYQYAYQTSNGISADEQGQLQNPGLPNEAIAARGQYSYIGPDGVTYSVVYTADENGFRPQGAHLPTN